MILENSYYVKTKLDLSNIPIYIVNHILSFRPTHPLANLIKNPCAKTCLQISDFWKNKSGFSYNISIELIRLDNFDNFKKT